jgi:hypothetical protein
MVLRTLGEAITTPAMERHSHLPPATFFTHEDFRQLPLALLVLRTLSEAITIVTVSVEQQAAFFLRWVQPRP